MIKIRKSDTTKTVLECIKKLKGMGICANLHDVPFEVFEDLGFDYCGTSYMTKDIGKSALFSQYYVGEFSKKDPSDIPKKLRRKIEKKLGMTIEESYRVERAKSERESEARAALHHFDARFVYAALRLILSGKIDDNKARDIFHKVALDWDYFKKNAGELAAKIGPLIGLEERGK